MPTLVMDPAPVEIDELLERREADRYVPEKVAELLGGVWARARGFTACGVRRLDG